LHHKKQGKINRNKVNTDIQQIHIGNIAVEIRKKNIKNLHLRVHPPEGSVRISAPSRMDLDSIRCFAVSKLGWIKKHQAKLKKQVREVSKEYISGESHTYLDKRYLLKVIELNQPSKIVLNHETIEMYVRLNTGVEKRKAILDEWYRQRLKELIPVLISKYEAKMKVKVSEFGVKKMKTRWGSCNVKVNRIWLNLELAKRSIECIEYLVVHEMAHLLERKHNERFTAFMDTFLPGWRFVKAELNKRPLCHEAWNY
jgi:predicted metal-dependent hydrolase